MCAYPSSSAPFQHFQYGSYPPNAYEYNAVYLPPYPQAVSAHAAMQQCYGRAKEYLVRALEIDENGGEDKRTAVDFYSKAVIELENGISKSYSGYASGEEAVAVENLRKKMMTNLDNARDRVNFLSRDSEMRMQPDSTHQVHPCPQIEHPQSTSSSTSRNSQFNKPSLRHTTDRKPHSTGNESKEKVVSSSKTTSVYDNSLARNHQKSSPHPRPAPADSLLQPRSDGQRDKNQQSLPEETSPNEGTNLVNRKDKLNTSNGKETGNDSVVKTKSKHSDEESSPLISPDFLQVPSKDKSTSQPQSSKSCCASPRRKAHGVDTKTTSTHKVPEKKGTGSKVEKTYTRRAPTEGTRGNSRQSSFKKSTDKKSANPVTGKKLLAANSSKVENKSSVVSDLKGVDKTLAETILEEVVDSDSLETTWDDIVGLEFPKKMLREIVVLPALRPELFTGLRSPCRGLLLFGPPGNGKTMLAKAVAHESQAKFFNISASSLTSKWLGDGERLVKALFALARKMQPSVIFLDEVDALLSRRGESEHDSMRRLKNEFLQSFDGMHTTEGERILVMAATNRPQELDDAALRRFGKRIFIPLPGLEARRAVLEALVSKHHHNITETQMEKLAEVTEGYSGSDLKTLASDASLGPIRELDLETLKNVPADEVRAITIDDFEQLLPQSRSSVSHDLIKAMEEWNANYGVSA